MAQKKVIVVSIDAMITSDIPVFKRQPNMGPLLEKCAIVSNSYCVYPTITYPCHVAIMTGCWPEKNGIFQNEILQINNPDNQPWYFFSKDIKVPGMFDYAKKAGLTTASVAWPVMCANPAIDYRISEIWPEHKEDDPTYVHRISDSENCFDIVDKYKHLLKHSNGTAYDEFATPCAVEIIERFKPDFMCVHLSHLDSHRHANGTPTDHNIDAIQFIDEKAGHMIEATKRAGTFEDTTFIFLGDHGQMDVHYVFSPNVYLAEKGYITKNSDGKITDWRIYVQGAGFSGHVVTQNIALDEAEQALNQMMEEYPQHVERVMTRAECKQTYHLDGPFDFAIEGQNHVIISQQFNGELVRNGKPDDWKYYKGSHGYAPEKGTNPPFIICGKRAKNGVVIPFGRLVDEAPTIMKLFGIDMPTADGKAYDMIK